MLRRFVILWLLTCCVNMVNAAEQNILEAVEGSSRAWLELNDKGRYAESWNAAAQYLRQQFTESEWIENVGEIRKPLGAKKDRYIATAGHATSLSGFPDGEYVVVQFYTTFENRTLALETVTLAKGEDAVWRVADYTIK